MDKELRIVIELTGQRISRLPTIGEWIEKHFDDLTPETMTEAAAELYMIGMGAVEFTDIRGQVMVVVDENIPPFDISGGRDLFAALGRVGEIDQGLMTELASRLVDSGRFGELTRQRLKKMASE